MESGSESNICNDSGTVNQYFSLTSLDQYALDQIFADPANGDYSLKVGSPAINKGNNDYVPKDIETDAAGLSRIAFETVDIGAYEYHAALTSVSISGTAEVGQTLTASVVAESDDPTATYQWYRDGKAIKDATEKTYKVNQEDFCCSLTVKASGTGNFSGTVVSDSIDPKTTTIEPTSENFKATFDKAKDGATIKFEPSETTQTISVTSTMNIKKSLTIDGTGANIVFDAAAPTSLPLPTTGDDPNDGEGERRLFEVEEGNTLTLTNVTIQNGSADYGGAIKNAGTLNLTGVTLTNNNATVSGGAIYNYGSGQATLTNVKASGNKAAKNGGVVFNDVGASLTVSGGTYSNNEATKNGGAFANYGETTISGKTTISDNRAKRFGGAYFGCGTLTVKNDADDDKTTFSGNTAGYDADKTTVLFDGAKGGAIYNDVYDASWYCYVGTVSITGTVEFSNNKAVERGGAIMSYSTDAKTTTLTVAGTTTFTGNEATQYGGAIDVGQYCNASLGGTLIFDGNKATSTNKDEGFGGAIFSVETLTFEAGGTYTFTGNTATKSGGAIDACDGTLTLAGDFTFNANVAYGVYDDDKTDDKTGLGGAIATAAVTTVKDGNFTWGDGNKAARGNCVALDSKFSPKLSSESFGLKVGDDYSTFTVIRDLVKENSVLVPTSFAPNAVVATITTSGVSTTFGAEGVTPEQLGLDAGTHEALIQYTDANGETSAVYSLVLTVDSAASLDVRETSFANGRGVKFDFNLTNADGRAVSVWEIAWGDGTTSRLEKWSTSWLAAHYYAQDGTFDVSLTVAYLDGTSETFEAFSTQRIGAAPVATTSKADALDRVFAESEDLFDEFEELDCLIPYGPMPLR